MIKLIAVVLRKRFSLAVQITLMKYTEKTQVSGGLRLNTSRTWAPQALPMQSLVKVESREDGGNAILVDA